MNIALAFETIGRRFVLLAWLSLWSGLNMGVSLLTLHDPEWMLPLSFAIGVGGSVVALNGYFRCRRQARAARRRESLERRLARERED